LILTLPGEMNAGTLALSRTRERVPNKVRRVRATYTPLHVLKLCKGTERKMNCENCAYYIYDEEIEDYICDADMDEDDYAALLESRSKSCPYWQNGDEYAVVRHQM